eukprot:SAG11_NODE_9901_length_871_cov_1.327720_1_plen_141_part_10
MDAGPGSAEGALPARREDSPRDVWPELFYYEVTLEQSLRATGVEHDASTGAVSGDTRAPRAGDGDGALSAGVYVGLSTPAAFGAKPPGHSPHSVGLELRSGRVFAGGEAPIGCAGAKLCRAGDVVGCGYVEPKRGRSAELG